MAAPKAWRLCTARPLRATCGSQVWAQASGDGGPWAGEGSTAVRRRQVGSGGEDQQQSPWDTRGVDRTDMGGGTASEVAKGSTRGQQRAVDWLDGGHSRAGAERAVVSFAFRRPVAGPLVSDPAEVWGGVGEGQTARRHLEEKKPAFRRSFLHQGSDCRMPQEGALLPERGRALTCSPHKQSLA